MSVVNYYAILGLASEATEDEIRRAYRRLALEWHPDRNPGNRTAEERFKEISEAYAVLVDATKRREYDRARQVGASGGFQHTREDIFRDLFADPRASAIFEELARELERMGMRVDRRYFEQTLFGGRAVVTGGVFIITPLTPVLALFRLARAAVRGASAHEGGARELPRPRGIFGRVLGAGRWLLGLPPAPSPSAPGAGDLVYPLRLTAAEAEAGGRKRITVNGGRRELLVTIPPGTRAGTRLRLRGQGPRSPEGRSGDLYLTVEIGD